MVAGRGSDTGPRLHPGRGGEGGHAGRRPPPPPAHGGGGRGGGPRGGGAAGAGRAAAPKTPQRRAGAEDDGGGGPLGGRGVAPADRRAGHGRRELLPHAGDSRTQHAELGGAALGTHQRPFVGPVPAKEMAARAAGEEPESAPTV